MHREARAFLEKVGMLYPSIYRSKRVLELGSLDINGSPRENFQGVAEYVGLDWRAGKGVDVVGIAHEYKGRENGHFDCVVSTEMLEHDPFWKETLKRALELLEPGGSMLLTMAGPGRHAHEVEVSPAPGYYQNMEMDAVLREVLAVSDFYAVYAEHNPNPGDLYFLFHIKK